MPFAVGFLIAYLLGALPFGYLIGRIVKGIDIRTVGSGNIGATNVARVLGPHWGGVALLLDALKGALPTALLPLAFVASDDPSFQHLQVVCAIGTILGHMWPIWLRFRGGKGVVAGLLGFVVIVAATRYVSLGSMIGSILFAATAVWRIGASAFSQTDWSLTLFCIAVPVLILYRHRANIGRLLRGEENRLGAQTNPSGSGRNNPAITGEPPSGENHPGDCAVSDEPHEFR